MIVIDYQSRQPIYEQIVERVQMLIIKGILPPDSQMPSVRSLAVELSINPNTIQKAYTILEQQGILYTVKGRGNFVGDSELLIARKKQAVFDELELLVRKGRDLGISKEECIRQMELYWKEETS